MEALLRDLFSNAEKARMRSLKDLDRSAATLVTACKVVLDSSISDDNVRALLFNDLPRTTLEKALEEVSALIRPADDVYFLALEARYRSVRRFLPDLLKHIRFGFSPAGKGVAASLDWLQLNLRAGSRRMTRRKRSWPRLGRSTSLAKTAPSTWAPMCSARSMRYARRSAAATCSSRPVGATPIRASACSTVPNGWRRGRSSAARWA
ncbi:hypothetical protein FQZ97_896880 [compost metagenome]